MKADISNKINRFARRTLAEFSESLLFLLEENSLEEITVQKLCDYCDYPRSTFYNYFKDIYDLMDYCWGAIARDMSIQKYMEIPEKERTNAMFMIMYDYLYMRRTHIKKILMKNGLDGKMMYSLRKYMKKQIKEIVFACSYTNQYPIRQDIIVDFYAITFEMLLEKCFFIKEALSKNEAEEALSFLLGAIEKEVHRN